MGGNRNHAGMPSGSRRFEAGPPGKGGPRIQQQRGAQQQKKPIYQPPPNVSTHFRTLGLAVTAKQDEVRKAYRRLALQYHPDKNLGKGKEEAEKIFQQVQNAYDKV